jgi:hypothetical protein
MNLKTFMAMLVEHVPEEHIDTLLQKIGDKLHDEGQCLFCGEEDVPVDKRGNEIEGDDVSMASEWREVHDADCPVALLEVARQGRSKQ